MSQAEVPDRRPLLYAVVGVIILGIAAVLFWPDNGAQDPNSLVLTPDSVRQASNLETPIEGSETETPAPGDETDVTEQDVPADRFTVEDAKLPDDATASSAEETPAKPAKTTSSPTPKPSSPPPATGSNELMGPGSSGHHLIYVGSYRDKINARRAAQRLIGDGIRADVVTSGSAHRVRVGFFATSEAAEAYGKTLKSRFGLDYWVSRR